MTVADAVAKHGAAFLAPGETVTAAVKIGFEGSSTAFGPTGGANSEGRYNRVLDERGETPDPKRYLLLGAKASAASHGWVLATTQHRVLVITRNVLSRPKSLLVDGPVAETRLRWADDAKASPDRRVFHVEFPPDGRWLIASAPLALKFRADCDAVVQALGPTAEQVDLTG